MKDASGSAEIRTASACGADVVRFCVSPPGRRTGRSHGRDSVVRRRPKKSIKLAGRCQPQVKLVRILKVSQVDDHHLSSNCGSWVCLSLILCFQANKSSAVAPWTCTFTKPPARTVHAVRYRKPGCSSRRSCRRSGEPEARFNLEMITATHSSCLTEVLGDAGEGSGRDLAHTLAGYVPGPARPTATSKLAIAEQLKIEDRHVQNQF